MAAEEGRVVGVHNIEFWTQQLEVANQPGKLAVIDFTASWCGPCKVIAPFFAELAKKSPHVLFLKVDVDKLKSVASDWAVNAMPTFMFVKDGKIVDQVVGAKKDELHQTLSKHMASSTTV